MNPIDNIAFEKKYKSGPLASTDIHAGGLFFCVPYEEIITFFRDGKVEMTKRVIETFRPLSGQHEIDLINNFKIEGTFKLTDRNYIKCEFDYFTMVGLPLEIHPDILTFHCSFKSGGRAIGKAYKLSDDARK